MGSYDIVETIGTGKIEYSRNVVFEERGWKRISLNDDGEEGKEEEIPVRQEMCEESEVNSNEVEKESDEEYFSAAGEPESPLVRRSIRLAKKGKVMTAEEKGSNFDSPETYEEAIKHKEWQGAIKGELEIVGIASIE